MTGDVICPFCNEGNQDEENIRDNFCCKCGMPLFIDKEIEGKKDVETAQ